jgi:diaminopimelate epimerase
LKVHFYKYQATGNDFILLDNRSGGITLPPDRIKALCDRRFGIGADGIILLEKDDQQDFKMVYFNSDGSQSLCGNGCRSAIDLASKLNLINGRALFSAYDGVHQGTILQDGRIRLQLKDVSKVERKGKDFFIHTGSPHLIRFVNKLRDFPVLEEGKKIRYSSEYEPGGTNVNFVKLMPDNRIAVRTYERGVENETLSCGTGVTAAALASFFQGYSSPVQVQAEGGELTVEFEAQGNPQSTGQAVTFTSIFLVGPAKMVFEGDLEL